MQRIRPQTEKILLRFSWFVFTILSFLLQSCSQSQIGKKLSESFDMEVNDPNSVQLLDKSLNNSDVINQNERNNSVQDSIRKKDAIVSNDRKKTNQRKYKSITSKKQPIKFTPQPYRITIKLSGANPSSPAESVTNALIKAGVRFEVERIERIDIQNKNDLTRPTRTRS
tara:strand:+ start:442 stop:948 length:507 start_codon:yes stop_codon:yes gene_type:complete